MLHAGGAAFRTVVEVFVAYVPRVVNPVIDVVYVDTAVDVEV